MSRNAGVVRGIWLHMLESGDPWTVERASLAAGLEMHYTDNLLRHMANTGLVKKSRRPGRKNGVFYAVTPECKIPGQTNLRDILRSSPRPQVVTCWVGVRPDGGKR